jgi:hypothetical protein
VTRHFHADIYFVCVCASLLWSDDIVTFLPSSREQIHLCVPFSRFTVTANEDLSVSAVVVISMYFTSFSYVYHYALKYSVSGFTNSVGKLVSE